MPTRPFHKILATSPDVVHRSRNAAVILDIEPITPGHVLICPLKPYADFHEVPDDVLLEINQLAKRCCRILLETTGAKGYSLMANAGTFNDLDHFHLHLFPRHAEGEFGWTYAEGPVRTGPELAKALRSGLTRR